MIRASFALAFAVSLTFCTGVLPAQSARFTGVQSAIVTGFATYGGIAVDSAGDVFIADDQNNRIVEKTSSTTVDIALGGGTPEYLALDGVGNLYVATTAPAALKKFTVSNGVYGASTTISTSFQTPWGVAVDGSGNIYVADHTGSQIIKFVYAGGSYTQVVYVNSGLNQPAGVAVDAVGNLYVADRGNNRIVEVSASGGSVMQTAIVNGLNSPSDVAVDSSGDLAIADENGLTYEQANAGSYTQSLLAGNFSTPEGVAFDAKRAIYIADTSLQRVIKQTPSVNFGSVAIQQISVAQTLMFVFDAAITLNGGNPVQVWTSGAPGKDFVDTHAGSCKSGVAFAVNATCTVSIAFSPTAAGSRSGSIVLIDDGGGLVSAGYASGNGLGPQLSYGPAAQLLVQNSLENPSGVAVDGAGNVYVAETSENRVLKLTPSAGAYSVSEIGSGMSAPEGLTLDAAGNVFVSDTGNNRVLKETLINGVYAQSVFMGSGISSPVGVAVDGAGNVYIADSGNNRVLKEALFNGSYTESVVVTGVAAFGVAVDGLGNLYISEPTDNLVLKETLNGSAYIQSTIGSGLNSPRGVAVDGAGNLYIADQSEVYKESLSGGVYVQSFIGGVYDARGLALDAAANIYVADTLNNRVIVDKVSIPPTIVFPGTVLEQTSGPLAVLVSNVGNQPLNFPPALGSSNPSVPGNFILEMEPDTTCPVVTSGGSASTLAAGASCILSYRFVAPAQVGASHGNSVLTDNNLNTFKATQDIALTGMAMNAQSITFPQPPSPVVAVLAETVNLTATASSGLPITYNISSGPAIVTGSSLTVTGTGSIVVTASQPGNANYVPAATVSRTIVAIAQPTDSYPFTNTALGSTSLSQTLTLQVASAGTAASIQVLTLGAANLDFKAASGGTCAIGSSYVVDEVCTVNVVFSPKYAGPRQGAVVLRDAGGIPLATAYLQGSGLGPQLRFAPGRQSALGSGFDNPFGVAVDGAGNVYIADSGSNRVLKETLASGTYTQSVVGSGLSAPTGVAVDGAGNVYIADFLNDRALKETLTGSTYIQSVIGSGMNLPLGITVDGSGSIYIGEYTNIRKETFTGSTYIQTDVVSGLVWPAGVAVDSFGNIYIADNAHSRILKETLASGAYTQTIIGSGMSNPNGVAVDGAGNVYVADSGNGRLVKEMSSGGSYSQSILVSGLNFVSGVAVDAAGNLYIADTDNNRLLKEALAVPPILSFPNTAVGVSSGVEVVTLTNSGNQPLAFPVPTSGTNPLTSANFMIESNANTTCPVVKAGSSAGTLAAGASCNLSYTFAPAQLGALSGTSVVTNNNLDITKASQSIVLTGTAVAAQSITFAPASPVAYISGKTIKLTATASSGLPVTLTLVNGPATITGSTVTITGTGVVNVTASQPGNASYAAATPVSRSILVVLAETGTGSKSSTLTVTLHFTSAGVPDSIQVLTEGVTGLDFSAASGGTCALGTQHGANSTCTMNVLFSPTRAGVRDGAVVIRQGDLPLAMAYLQAIGQGPQLAFAPATQSPVKGGLNNPKGVAVDGAGNIYISDSSDNVVRKESFSGSVYSDSIIASSLNSPIGIAVDGAGNVYIADSLNNRVLKETPYSGSYSQSIIVPIGISAPSGIAVDAVGNVYVVDTGNKRVLKETPLMSGYVPSVVASGLDAKASSVAVDSIGNVYIANGNNNQVLKETVSGAGYVPTTVFNGLTAVGVAVDGFDSLYIAGNNSDTAFIMKETQAGGAYLQSTFSTSGLNGPSALAVDGSGNVSIADTLNSRVMAETISTPPSLVFANTRINGTSAPLAATLTNLGNKAAAFAVPSSGTNPSPAASFVLETNADTTCAVVKAGASAGTLAPNASCSLSYAFTPTQIATISAKSILTDDNLNTANAIQPITLTGTGIQDPQTIMFPQPSPVAYVSGKTINLTASASSGLPVSYTVASGPGALAGSILTITGIGSVQVTATQSGNTTYAAAVAVTDTIAVTYPNGSIGSQGSPQTITVQFSNGGTLASMQVVTQGVAGLDFDAAVGGTCSIGIAYVTNQTCTVKVVFSPKRAGNRMGAVALLNASGVPLATAYVQGIGLGPQLAFGPLVQKNLGSGLNGTGYIALDGAGNVYMTNSSLDGTVNEVLKETLVNGNYTQTALFSSGLNHPGGLAVDGRGNVYIADWGNSRVLKETVSGSSYTQTPVGSGLGNPIGVAVDGAGNVYIIDGYARVVKESPAGTTYIQNTIVSGLSDPRGIALDGAGNIYIADYGSSRVLKETLAGGSYTQSIVFNTPHPNGVAVDAAGNLYVTTTLNPTRLFNTNVVKETVNGTTYIQSIIGSGFTNLAGIAVDGGGNLYFADSEAHSTYIDAAAISPSLVFPSTAVGARSAAQLVTLSNIGNQPLTFSVPSSGSNPLTGANFLLESNSDTTCPIVKAGASAGSLAANGSCQLSYRFAPTKAGILSGTSVLTANNLNLSGATQTITLSSSSAQPQSITFPQPTQAIYPGGGTLAATASSGLPVSYTVISGAAILSGSELEYFGAGPVVVQASQAGNTSYAPAPPVSISIKVTN